MKTPRVEVPCPYCGEPWVVPNTDGNQLVQCSSEAGSCGGWFVVNIETTPTIRVWKVVEGDR